MNRFQTMSAMIQNHAVLDCIHTVGP